MAETIMITIAPQVGPQTKFIASSADIVVYGGAAGGGKTWALLLEPLRHINNPRFGATVFRRTYPEIMSQGGMWDETQKLYRLVGGVSRESALDWRFSRGSTVKFAHMQNESDMYSYQGAQIPLICIDQLELFTERQFWFLFSRNRSTCGVKPYIRATCNPDPESFVRRLIEWWIGADGYPLGDRSGLVRWFVRVGDELVWANTKEELLQYVGHPPKSLTFIPAQVTDNKVLLDNDPGYMANLMALPYVERERLLKGNWLVKHQAGKVFNRGYFSVVGAASAGGREVRFWDLAATRKEKIGDDPDYTAGIKVKVVDGIVYILDLVTMLEGPAEVDQAIKNIAMQDGRGCLVRWEKEPGASGVRDNARMVQMLAGFDAAGIDPLGDKVVRAKPVAAQAQAGNVRLVAGPWNERCLSELHNFPDGAHDDVVDALSGAYNVLVIAGQGKSRRVAVKGVWDDIS